LTPRPPDDDRLRVARRLHRDAGAPRARFAQDNAAIGGGLALIAFLIAERRSANPMMPLSMFSSRQFSAANAVTFVVFGAFSGVFFLLVAFLQISLGYSPLEAGGASLPITALI
jgi:hypothetical protein